MNLIYPGVVVKIPTEPQHRPGAELGRSLAGGVGLKVDLRQRGRLERRAEGWLV